MNHNQENEIIIEAAGLSKTYRRYKKKEGIRGSITGLFKRESLSLGERMKMELMVALLHGPRVLFPDEPTIGLDAIASRQIRNFLQEINREKHTTILLTFHYVEDIRTLCERAVAVSPLFRLSFEQINPGSLPLVCMSLCIIGYGIRTGGLRPGGGISAVDAADGRTVLRYGGADAQSAFLCVVHLPDGSAGGSIFGIVHEAAGNCALRGVQVTLLLSAALWIDGHSAGAEPDRGSCPGQAVCGLLAL